MTERQLRLQIIDTGKRLANKGYIPATDGNISVRLNESTVIITPSGLPKGELHPDDLVAIDMEGRTIRGANKPSSEYDMHLTVYRLRRDLIAVVHAHPPFATAFALAHQDLILPGLPEVIVTLNRIPLSEYATPGTPQIGLVISELIRDHKAILLRNHGVLTAGKDLTEAYQHMERVEHFAKIVHLARQLGGAKSLTAEQLDELHKIWGKP